MLPAWTDSAVWLVLPDLAGEPVRFGFDSCRDIGSMSLRAAVPPYGVP
jgi:hypothetical protein